MDNFKNKPHTDEWRKILVGKKVVSWSVPPT